MSGFQHSPGSDDPAHEDVSRIELLEVLDAVFEAPGQRGLTKQDLLAAAVAAGARPAVLDQLRRLPDRDTFRVRTDLWAHLGDLPVGI